MCLIQDPQFCKEQVGGMNCIDTQLVYYQGGLRPEAAVFMRGVRGNVVPGFTTRDLVALQIKRGEHKDQKDAMVRLAYFHQILR